MLRKSIAAVSLSVIASACATTDNNRDPLEPVNRATFAFNAGVDAVLIKPASQAYKAVTPKPVREGVSNFLENLGTPASFFANVLAGDINAAGNDLYSFAVNTTFGLGGVIDVAELDGYGKDNDSFDKTLKAWGVSEGPYVVLPLLGPTTARGATGRVLSIAADPINYLEFDGADTFEATTRVLTILDQRLELEERLSGMQASRTDAATGERPDFYTLVRDQVLNPRAEGQPGTE